MGTVEKPRAEARPSLTFSCDQAAVASSETATSAAVKIAAGDGRRECGGECVQLGIFHRKLIVAEVDVSLGDP